MMLKRVFVHVAIFLAGALAGALAVGSTDARALVSYNHALQVGYRTEQAFRAVRAEREGDLLRALHHQWNAVDAHSEAWLRMFYNWTTPPPWYGLAYLGLGHIAASADPTGVGDQRVESESRGYLARLLEVNGFQQRSMAEWQRAAQLLGKSTPTEVRRFIETLGQVRNSEDYRRAEEVVLGER